MYLDYWGLAEKPFAALPDPRFLCETRQHAAALQQLETAVEERLGAALLTGAVGSGKTLLARTLAERLDPSHFRSVLIPRPQPGPVNLLRDVAAGLGEDSLPSGSDETAIPALMPAIQRRLEESLRGDVDTVLILDEAQLISSRATFENLRLILNMQMDQQPLLTLILVGQTELLRKVDLFEPLEQRIGIKCTLGGLTREEARLYVAHRLGVAGCDRPIFTDGALDLVFEFSEGIPRQINRLCVLGLIGGFARTAKVIDEGILWEQVQVLTTGALPGLDTEEGAADAIAQAADIAAVRSDIVLYHAQAVSLTKGVFHRARLGEPIAAGVLRGLVERMLDLLEHDEEPFMEVFFRHFGMDYLFAHAVNVASLGMLVGRHMDLKRDDLIVLGVTGLLHDIGLMRNVKHRHRAPSSSETGTRKQDLATSLGLDRIVSQPRRLTEVEHEELKKHPIYAHETVSAIEGLDPRIAEYVYQHRERIDGEGYPRGLRGEEIHPQAQLTALCCVFESLTHPRQHRGKQFPDEAMNYVTSLSGKHFEGHLVAAFLRHVGMYPLTSWVELSSGEVGRVVALNPDAILRPVVEVTFDGQGHRLQEPFRINLNEQRFDRIVRMIDERID